MFAVLHPDRAPKRRGSAAARHACAVLASVVALSTALPASAAPNQHDRAQTLFKKGRQAYMKGDFKTAYQDQRSAWELMKTFDIAANLGQAELQLHLYRDAAQHFRYALDHFPPSGDARKKRRLQQNFDAARAKVGALALHVQPDGATLSVDGASVEPPLPSTLFLDPGAHTLGFAADGYTPQKKSVTAKAGGDDKLDVTLQKASSPAASSASAGPGATPAASDSAAGDATPAASDATPPASPPPATDTGEHHGPDTRTLAIIGGAGLTAVALGVGVGFLVDGNSADSNASDLRAQAIREVGNNGCAANPDAGVCVSLRNANDHAHRSHTISTVGFVGAGVFGVATLGAVLFWPKHHEQAAARTRHGHGYGFRMRPVVLGATGLGVDYPDAPLFSAAGIGVKGHF